MQEATVGTEVIRGALELACRAPSLFNSQPWRWIVENATVQLFLDKDRVLYSTDHTGREAILGCGAALDHLRVAMAAVGWTTHVERFPNPNNRLHLATVAFSPMEFTPEGFHIRANAILRRRTDRLPFAEPPQWDVVEPQLYRSVTAQVVRLDVLAEDLRSELAQASALTESFRLYDTPYHAEMRWWTQPFVLSEGIPHSSLVSESELERVDVGRRFPLTHNSQRRAEFGHDQSKILVLSTYDNERSSILHCGETLSAVLLEATMAGLASCTLTHITELQASRDIVASLIGQPATPQALIRVGLAPEIENAPPPTPRRPIDEVTEFH
jgi:hypothetical protein